MFNAAQDDASEARTSPAPMIEIAERHLRLLAEVAELAMAAARASGALLVATAEAAAKIVAEKDGAWACEADKACAVRASREAADAFTRVTRALRLTLTLETATAERLRDLRAGVAPTPGGGAERQVAGLGAFDSVGEKARELVAEVAAKDGDVHAALDFAHDLRERLTESDRFGPLLSRPLVEVVALICADIGLSPDWSRWSDADFASETHASRKQGQSFRGCVPEPAEAGRRMVAAPAPDPRPPDP